MPLYDCKCQNGHSFEKMIRLSDRESPIECPVCGETAKVVPSATRSKLDGTDPSLPGAYMKWARDREKKRSL